MNTHYNVSDQELAAASGGIARPKEYYEEQKNWGPLRWLFYYTSGESSLKSARR